MIGRRKTVTGEDALIAGATVKTLPEEMAWFYNQVLTFRGKVTEEMVAKKEAEIEAAFITHLSDICMLFDWQKGRDTENRNRLAHLASQILMAHKGQADTAVILFSAMKRTLKDDYKDPMDMILSKKEARKARKVRKTMEKNGVSLTDKLPKDNDAKTAARRERQKLRKEAKKLGITTAELKAKR